MPSCYRPAHVRGLLLRVGGPPVDVWRRPQPRPPGHARRMTGELTSARAQPGYPGGPRGRRIGVTRRVTPGAAPVATSGTRGVPASTPDGSATGGRSIGPGLSTREPALTALPPSPPDQRARIGLGLLPVGVACDIRDVARGRTPGRAPAPGIDKRPVAGRSPSPAPGPKGTGAVGLRATGSTTSRTTAATTRPSTPTPGRTWTAGRRSSAERWRTAGVRREPDHRRARLNGALIGERWRIGPDVVLEVSCPRIPCGTFQGWLASGAGSSGSPRRPFPGAYLRVMVERGDQLRRPVDIMERPDHEARPSCSSSRAFTARARTFSPRGLLEAQPRRPVNGRTWKICVPRRDHMGRRAERAARPLADARCTQLWMSSC